MPSELHRKSTLVGILFRSGVLRDKRGQVREGFGLLSQHALPNPAPSRARECCGGVEQHKPRPQAPNITAISTTIFAQNTCSIKGRPRTNPLCANTVPPRLRRPRLLSCPHSLQTLPRRRKVWAGGTWPDAQCTSKARGQTHPWGSRLARWEHVIDVIALVRRGLQRSDAHYTDLQAGPVSDEPRRTCLSSAGRAPARDPPVADSPGPLRAPPTPPWRRPLPEGGF